MHFRSGSTRFLRALILVSGPLLLSACASSDRAPKVVRTTPVDFQKSFEEMLFKVLPPEKQVRLAINDEDPRFSFEGGFSRYESLVLPDLPQPYLLKIESEVVKGAANYNGTIFFPVLTFLDADKKWIKTFDTLPYVTQKPVGAQNFIVVSIQISDELAAARYVVIHTQEDKYDKAIGREDGEILMLSRGYDSMMFAPYTKPRYRYDLAPQGWVRIKAFSVTKTEQVVDNL